jgi:hypothetical protein
MRHSTERGIAMITTLLVLMLMSALLVGFTTIVMSDQRYRFIDRDRGQAFYAAAGGIEKLAADLGDRFLISVAPTATQINDLTATPPSITDGLGHPIVTYAADTPPTALPASLLTRYHCRADPTTGRTKTARRTTNNDGYSITFCRYDDDPAGNPTTSDDATTITGTGSYAGLIGLQTPYQLDVTAKTLTGGEVHLVRTVTAVAIPVFQFMIFSESDQSFFAGPNFGFAGRVHTNGNLWLAQGDGATLTMTGRVTALRDVIRQNLSNGISIDNGSGWAGAVNLATSTAAPAGNRNLLRTEGSIEGMPGSPGYSGWQTLSLGGSPVNYNGFLRSGTVGARVGTGAKRLNLPLTTPGILGCVPSPCTNVEIVRRPLVGEDMTDILYNERLFSKASLRILLSDTPGDITNLPGVSAGAPVPLDGNWNVALPVAGYGPVTLSSAAVPPIDRPPVALSAGPLIAQVNGNSVAVGALPATWTITPDAATFPVFVPTFTLAGFATPITCTAKSTANPWRLTGCTGISTTVVAPVNTVLTAVSPAGGYSGASAPISVATSTGGGGNGRLEFVDKATLDRFNVWPFWNSGTAAAPANTLVTCTGFNAPAYTGCSSGPIDNSILTSAAMSNPGVGTLGGFIKIERQNANSTWTDVTVEILNYGIGDVNTSPADAVCPDPTPYAIIRLQRLRDNGDNAAALVAGGGCNYDTNVTGARDPANWWPNVLFDAREGLLRDSNYPGANNLTLGGVMHYVNLDAGNLARWFKHNTAPFNVAASTGNLSKVDGTGYTVYFSDRRNNRNALAAETGEYGWEDFVNPAVANGVPNGLLDSGEDLNAHPSALYVPTLDVYGGIPNYTPPGAGGLPAINAVPPCGVAGALCTGTYGAAAQPASTGYVLSTAARPTWTLPVRVARVNRAILFRRALMLSNGAGIGANAIVNDRLRGLTIVSENPVYLKGDWNADTPAGTGFAGVNAASAVIADAVTLLSNEWTDAISFAFPYDASNRNAITPTWYRVAIIAGKGMSFTLPTVGGGLGGGDFGTDGGAHNFLRFLEEFGGQPLNYLGSLASLYYNRQAVGTYKCCTAVYGPPTRFFNFDVNFLNPALLPPNTPMFRDMNAVGFSQELRPGR